MGEEMYYWHSLPLQFVRHGVIESHPEFCDDPDYLPAYRWLETQVGFYPLFLAVGGLEAVHVTGYPGQWRVNMGSERLADGSIAKVYRKRGEFPNDAVFAFATKNCEQGRFTDYQWWNIVIGEAWRGADVSAKIQRILFKRSWSKADWLRVACKDGHCVQLVAPKLDLRQAQFVFVRNQKARRQLLAMGFKNVIVRRFPLHGD